MAEVVVVARVLSLFGCLRSKTTRKTTRDRGVAGDANTDADMGVGDDDDGKMRALKGLSRPSATAQRHRLRKSAIIQEIRLNRKRRDRDMERQGHEETAHYPWEIVCGWEVRRCREQHWD